MRHSLAAARTVAATAALLVAATRTPVAAQAPLWGALEPGPHAVGFRQLLLRDASRPALADADGEPAGGAAHGRQMQVAIWYPASATSAPRLRFGAYLDALAQELDFSPLDARRRWAGAAKLVAQAGGLGGDTTALRAALPRLAALATAAVLDAAPAAGRFPVVLFPEWRMPATNGVMAEHLASHGYVVASTSLKGTFDAGVEVTARGLETLAADLRFVLAAVDTLPFADATRVGAVGVGIAASGALALQMRTPAVRALVSLDGGITTPLELGLLAATPYHDPAAVSVPILAIHAPHPSVDPSLLDRYRYAPRTQVRFPGMGEFWFLSFGPLEREVPGIIGRPPGDVAAGFEWAARWVRAFLDAHLLGGAGAAAALASLAESPAARGVFEVTRRDALPPPPGIAELKRVLLREGVAGVGRLADTRAALDSLAIPADYLVTLRQWLANYGHDASGARRDTLATLHARLYPRSARAQLLAGLAALQRGDSARARGHAREAGRLLPADDDPALDAPARQRLDAQTRALLERLGGS